MFRIFFLGLLSSLLLLTGVATRNGPLIGLAIPPTLYLLAAWWWSAGQPAGLEIRRTLSDERVTPGSSVTTTLQVWNRGPALDEALVEDLGLIGADILEGSTRRLVQLPSGAELALSCAFRTRRGYYALREVRVTGNDAFGLFPRTVLVSTEGHVFVPPNPARLRRISIRPRRTRIYSGSIPAREGGPGVEFFGVRSYEQGDSLRWINWRVSARHQEHLFSNEFEQERVADVGIILDARIATNLAAGFSIFEYSASAAASLALAFLEAGNRVGLLIYGKYADWTVPGYGKLQGERILQAIARAQVDEFQTFGELIIPRRLFPAYSQMVVVSPLKADDLRTLFRLRAMGYQVIAVTPDPVRYEMSRLPDSASTRTAARIIGLQRKLLLQRLERAGVHLVDWDVEVPFEQVIYAALSRPPVYLRALDWKGIE
jgi:uncharacterized protein (DUF58 family)